jgi:hypothetical protein
MYTPFFSIIVVVFNLIVFFFPYSSFYIFDFILFHHRCFIYYFMYIHKIYIHSIIIYICYYKYSNAEGHKLLNLVFYIKLCRQIVKKKREKKTKGRNEQTRFFSF